MILEVAILDVIPGREKEYEEAFALASGIISSMKGYVSHELKKCIERENRYLLLVEWKTLADHTEGFRKSDGYKEWKNLLHHFYDPFPTVEHYESVASSKTPQDTSDFGLRRG
jgi:heme-degrading monooxygenase HmoA